MMSEVATKDVITFACPHCRKVTRVSGRFAGRAGRCPGCRGAVRVPEQGERDEPLGLGSPVSEPGGGGSKGLGKAPRRPSLERDLTHEGHVLAIGVWYRLIGLLMTILIALMVPLVLAGGGRTFLAAGVAAAIAPLVYGAGSIAVGFGLARHRTWARWTVLALVAVNLLHSLLTGQVAGLIVGLPWGIAVLWALVGARGANLFSPEYRRLVEATPDVKVRYWASPFFYVPIGLSALAILLALIRAGS